MFFLPDKMVPGNNGCRLGLRRISGRRFSILKEINDVTNIANYPVTEKIAKKEAENGTKNGAHSYYGINFLWYICPNANNPGGA